MMITTSDLPTGSDPIGTELERRRLEHRERRVAHVVGLLRARRETYRAGGTVPTPLGAAIRDFDRELAGVRRRLAELRRFTC